MSTELAQPAPLAPPNWFAALRGHVRAHPAAAAGLVAALLVIAGLAAQNMLQVAAGTAAPGLRYALLGGAAGMMLAASAFSLLLPGLEAGAEILGGKALAAGVVVLGMALGVLLMLGLDEFTPHEHDKTGPCGPGHERCGRVWLFVFAIALHNLPEGMAIGVSFARGDMAVGLPLAMRAAGFPAWVAVGVAAASGLLEPLGALLGVGLASGLAVAYPIGLGLAAGAMIFVVSHEVIPQTHRNGHQTPATLGLMAGFALMMVLDTTLG